MSSLLFPPVFFLYFMGRFVYDSKIFNKTCTLHIVCFYFETHRWWSTPLHHSLTRRSPQETCISIFATNASVEPRHEGEQLVAAVVGKAMHCSSPWKWREKCALDVMTEVTSRGWGVGEWVVISLFSR